MRSSALLLHAPVVYIAPPLQLSHTTVVIIRSWISVIPPGNLLVLLNCNIF